MTTLARYLSTTAIFCALLAPTGVDAEQMPGMIMSTPMPKATSPISTTEIPVVRRPLHPGWPSPIEDNPQFTYALADQLEYRSATNGAPGIKFDGFGWSGGDIKRLWFKTEGFASSTSRAREGEISLLYGRLVKPFYDFQAGLRFVPSLGIKPSRTYAVVGYQGLAPYNFDVEPSLFVSQNGKISARFTTSYDVLFTQRLILQPRLETNLALQKDEAVGIGSGINDIDLGLRLRYEFRREFAPYIGIAWVQKFGQAHAFALREGTDHVQLPILAGIHVWF
jgi:copper resistance protein B